MMLYDYATERTEKDARCTLRAWSARSAAAHMATLHHLYTLVP